MLTGGTSLGLGKYKPQWLAEIGTRKTEMFDGQTWTPLPSMNRAKVLITVLSYQSYVNCFKSKIVMVGYTFHLMLIG